MAGEEPAVGLGEQWRFIAVSGVAWQDNRGCPPDPSTKPRACNIGNSAVA